MLRQRDFLGGGWSYPVALDPLSGDIALSRYERDVREAIRIILETAPGERVMRPRFGCGIHDLVFEEISATTLFRGRGDGARGADDLRGPDRAARRRCRSAAGAERPS